jgi:hypothetical protein
MTETVAEYKVKKTASLKLLPFDWIGTNQAQVNLTKFTYPDKDGMSDGYRVSLALWINKLSKEKVVPIFLETQIFGDTPEEGAELGAELAININGSVLSDVEVFDEYGDTLESVDLNDVMGNKCSGCTNCECGE